METNNYSGFYPPNLESKSDTTSPQFWLRFPQFLTQASLSILGFFLLQGESFVKGVVCSVNIGGSFDLQLYQTPYFSLGASCAHQV